MNGTRGILDRIEGPKHCDSESNEIYTLSPDEKTFVYVTVDGHSEPLKFPMSITKTGPLSKTQEVVEVSVPFQNGPAMTIHKVKDKHFQDEKAKDRHVQE